MISDWLNSAWATLKTFQLKDAVDIVIVALIIYYLFRLIRQTRSAQLVKGLVILMVAYVISSAFNLTMINSILKMIFEFAVIIIVIIFQPEIRKILESMGKRNFTKSTFKTFVSSGVENTDEIIEKAIGDVCDSCVIFSRNMVGALIVFERETYLSDIAGSGTMIDSETSVSMLTNIFYKGAPLHDGACLIREGRICSAGCILPLSKRGDLSMQYGTRHRAALGITEESDAVVVVVSEETGIISLVVRGGIERSLTRTDLHNRLSDLLLKNTQPKSNLFSTLFRKGKEEKKA